MLGQKNRKVKISKKYQMLNQVREITINDMKKRILAIAKTDTNDSISYADLERLLDCVDNDMKSFSGTDYAALAARLGVSIPDEEVVECFEKE